jgi:NhaP-type Na+/H+ or K+/H+ antiporter
LLLITMVLAGASKKRMPVSASMLYLAVGYGLGAAGWGLMEPDSQDVSVILERVTEIALLISLFSVGMKLGLPFSSPHWRLPLRLAFVSMALTVGLITVVGVFLLDLPLGVAVLLGGILAPTDPVLASEVQVEEAHDRDRLRFSLSGEGGLNDGAAFPFVMLGLGLIGARELGAGGWRWLTVDVFWALAAGVAIGSLLGAMIGRLVVYLRTRHQQAVGLDEFLALGLVALAFSIAQLAHASAFLSVFAAGLALQRVKERSRSQDAPHEGPAGLLGASVSGEQRLLIAWFGIRGIGSIYYLMFALNNGLSGTTADRTISITLLAVAASIILYGVSVTPLMTFYGRRQARKARYA